MAPHPPDYLRQTAQALNELKPDWLIPMHCSGEPFIAVAQQVLGDKVLRSSTGTRFTFGAQPKAWPDRILRLRWQAT